MRRRASAARSTRPASAAVLVSALALIALVVSGCAGDEPTGLHAVAPPLNAPADIEWYDYRTALDRETVVGVVRADPDVVTHVGVLLVPGSDGFSNDYIKLARELAVRGIDVATGCWFANPDVHPREVRIACEQAPEFQGVTADAVADLDDLVAGAYQALGPYSRLVVVGFSRGGGIAALRAAHGAPEPVVSIAGMVAGTSAWGSTPGEVDVVAHAGAIDAPVLILHGESDWLIPVEHARAFEAALRAAGKDVEAVYYEGLDHGLMLDAATHADVVEQIAAFACTRLACFVRDDPAAGAGLP